MVNQCGSYAVNPPVIVNQPTRSGAQSVLSPRSPLDIEQITSRFQSELHEDALQIPADKMVILLKHIQAGFDEALENNNDPLSQEMAEAIVDLVDNDSPQRTVNVQPGSAFYEFIQQAIAYITKCERDRGGEPLNQQERRCALIDFLGKIVNNEFEGNCGRWCANLTNVGVRTGAIVSLATLLRQLVGFCVERAEQLGCISIPNQQVIGISSMLVGPALNCLGFIRDEYQHTATTSSRIARVFMGVLSIGSIIAVSQIGGAARVSSLGVQILFYTLARDCVQSCFPLTNNAPTNLKGVVAGSIVYSIFQILLGKGMDAWSPNSGADFARQGASSPQIDQDIFRSLLNGGGEITDEILYPLLNMCFREKQPDEPIEDLRIKVGCRLPTCSQLLDNFLTTCAMRTALFHSSMALGSVTNNSLSHRKDLSEGFKEGIMDAVGAATIGSSYPAFVYAHTNRSPKAEELAERGMELRQRNVGTSSTSSV